MVPSPISEDYYMILEVEQTATAQVIVKSYRHLAKKYHPDRNDRCDATEVFQRVGQLPRIRLNSSSNQYCLC